MSESEEIIARLVNKLVDYMWNLNDQQLNDFCDALEFLMATFVEGTR